MGGGGGVASGDGRVLVATGVSESYIWFLLFTNLIVSTGDGHETAVPSLIDTKQYISGSSRYEQLLLAIKPSTA